MAHPSRSSSIDDLISQKEEFLHVWVNISGPRASLTGVTAISSQFRRTTRIMRLQTIIYGTCLALSSCVRCAKDDQVPLSNDYVCEDAPYRVHMVSKSPLVIYITDFLTERERAHLQAITFRLSPHPLCTPAENETNTTPSSKDTFSHSGVTGDKTYNPKIRTSQSTTVPRDAVVRCIEDRALHFQGFDVPRSHLEPLQLVKYGVGTHFHFHTDWYTDPSIADVSAAGNRASSFFAYVRVDNGTTGGGTNFPVVDAPGDERWCERGFVDCDEEWERGVTFRPVEGNAVFWHNLLPDGRGDARTLHAGLPVTSGGKIGMNIWTRQAPLSEEVRGPDVW
jgi:prolyl 4-hydroxylase